MRLSREILAGGLTVVDAIERLLSEHLEDSLWQSVGDRIVKAPRAVVHPGYYMNRFQNLAALRESGYSTWYPELRFAIGLNDALEISNVETSGLELESITYGDGIERQYTHKKKKLKTQVNHILRFNKITIPSVVFAQTIRFLSEENEIDQPYIANLAVGCERFVDDRIVGFRMVSFDHVVTGERRFCNCQSEVHAKMLIEAKSIVSNFVSNSWPHRVISLLENASYAEDLCHFCVSERHGQNAPRERYGDQIQKHFIPYVDLLVRSTNMDHRTARAEAKRRLSISRWAREEELYQLISMLFPTKTIRREASPRWLGQQRLDIYLPELSLAIEHQGEQHYSPIEALVANAPLRKLGSGMNAKGHCAVKTVWLWLIYVSTTH